MSVNSVSAGPIANAPVNQTTAQTSAPKEQNSKAKLSNKGKLILLGLSILGVYSGASIINNVVNKSISINNCKKIEEGIPEIIAKIKAEMEGIIKTAGLAQEKANENNLSEQTGKFIFKNGTLTQLQKDSEIEEGATIIELVKGKITTIFEDYSKKEGGIDVYKNIVFFNGDNKNEFAKGCNYKDSKLLSSQDYYFFENSEVTRATTGYINKNDISKLYSTIIDFDKNSKINYIQENVEQAHNKVSCEFMYRKNQKGKWKRV